MFPSLPDLEDQETQNFDDRIDIEKLKRSLTRQGEQAADSSDEELARASDTREQRRMVHGGNHRNSRK